MRNGYPLEKPFLLRHLIRMLFAAAFPVLFLLIVAPLTVRASGTGDLTGNQWGFAADDGIRVPNWNSPDGNMKNEIIVAVLDGGIDYTHEDLKDVIYQFSEEEQAALNCGRYGYDATTGENNDPPPDDHASHVAGIIGASWNGFGISGVGSDIKIISIRCSVGNDTPLDYCLEAYAFINRCLDYGIPIRAVNNSWGNVDSSLAMNEMVETVGKKGCLSIFTAGNYGDNLEDTIYQPEGYFASSPYAVVVGACDRNGEKASFSCHGETKIDLYAPGVNILSAMALTGGAAYDYMNGTSMACPAVTGAAAYLAGNHPEITDAPGLRTLLLSCVRETAGLNSYYANGMLDLSVDESGDYAPVITEVSASGRQLTVRGAHFGTEAGELLVMDDTNGGSDEELETQSLSWSDNLVTVTLADDMPAIVRIYLQTQTNGKHDAALLFTGKSAAVYESDLSLPHGTDAADKIDSASDYQAAGFLDGIDGNLYYMPLVFLEEDIILAYDLLFAYDIVRDTWTSRKSLPEKVISAQAAVYESSIIVTGVSRDLSHAVAYRYDPEADNWEELDASGIPLYASVVNADGTLLLVGGADGEAAKQNPLSSVLTYDPESGACEPYATLQSGVWGAQCVYGEGILYVYGHVTGSDRINRQVFQRLREDTAEILSGSFPSFRPGEGNRRPKFNTALHGALCAGRDGIYLVGPMSDDGKADTYRMGYDETTFSYYEKRLSDAPAFWPAACAYSGTLYAIARSMTEPGFELFRATPVDTFTMYEFPEEPEEEEPDAPPDGAAAEDGALDAATADGALQVPDTLSAPDEATFADDGASGQTASPDGRMLVIVLGVALVLLVVVLVLVIRSVLRKGGGNDDPPAAGGF